MAVETFARQWGTQLTAKVRVKAQVSSGEVIMQTYDDYAASLPSTTSMAICALEGAATKAVLQFPTSAALTWISHMLGGNGTQPAPERKFTQIEQALVRRLMEEALEDLQYSFGTLLANPISLESIQYNAQFAQAAAPKDLMIVSSFTVTVGEETAEASMAIPSDVLLPQLGATNPMTSAADAKNLIRDQLSRVPMDVSLQLSAASVKPGMILNLSVGDVLPLPHPTHRPLDVTVDGQRLARAAAGTNGSRLAAVIVTTEEYPR